MYHNFSVTHTEGIEDEMYGESNMETYITIWKIVSQWEFVLCFRELKQWLCINLEPIDINELCQKEKDKYRILTHIYRI